MNIELLARSDKPVLIEGETGVGKTQLAKKIFESSNRKSKSFCHLNIAALNEDLFESELFGHVKGSFTGATEDKKGFCEIVGNGVLFVDEVGELSLSKQASLLSLIDENIFYKVGSTQKMLFKGKLIFATNRDLKEMVKDGSFRKDLYYRLRFFHIQLSPLRLKNNLKEIIWSTLQDLKIKNNSFNVLLNNEVVQCLCKYEWPGNYRELSNTLEYLIELNKERISINDVPSWIKVNSEQSYEFTGSYKEALWAFEKDFLIKQLSKYNGKINLTSLETGINKVTLISKLKKYHIDRKDYIINRYGQVNGF